MPTIAAMAAHTTVITAMAVTSDVGPNRTLMFPKDTVVPRTKAAVPSAPIPANAI